MDESCALILSWRKDNETPIRLIFTVHIRYVFIRHEMLSLRAKRLKFIFRYAMPRLPSLIRAPYPTWKRTLNVYHVFPGQR